MVREAKMTVIAEPGERRDSVHVVSGHSPRALSVCHIVSGDCWAGAEVQASTLVRALCCCGEIRVSAIVLNEGRLASEFRQAGAVVKVIPEAQNSFLRILAEATPFVCQQGVQILHSHRYKENLLSNLLALRCRIPVKVQTQHGMPEPFTGWKSLRQVFHQRLDQWSGRLAADAVVAVSAEMTPAIRRVYGSRKVVVIRNGIDTAHVASRLSREEAKAHIGCTPAPVIGMAGRLEPVKRVDLFLGMAKIVAEQVPGAQFVVAGDGSLRQSLTALARQSGLKTTCSSLGIATISTTCCVHSMGS